MFTHGQLFQIGAHSDGSVGADWGVVGETSDV